MAIFSPQRTVRTFSLHPQFLEQFHNKQPKWGPLGFFTYKRTYSRPVGSNGRLEEFWETLRRVTEGVYNVQKIHCRNLGLPWDEARAQRSAQEMFQRMWGFKFLPPGRGLWMMGTSYVLERGSAALNNCFGGETEILTGNGVQKIGELVGTTQKVLSKDCAWVEAPIKSFGKQRLYRLVLSRQGVEKEIFCTKEHRWFARDRRQIHRGKGFVEFQTSELRPDVHHLQYAFGSGIKGKVSPSPFGVAHGFVFGDGRTVPGQKNANSVPLIGKKDQVLKPYFQGCPERKRSDGVEFGSIPNFFRERPSLQENKSYLLGWLMGYFAADGSVSGGQTVISSVSKENLEFVRDVCVLLGIGTYSIGTDRRISNLTDQPHTMYRMNLMRDTLMEKFFLMEHHRALFVEKGAEKVLRRNWTVLSVEPTDRYEEVFCATVPHHGAFTLEGNILTGNCAFISTQDIDVDFADPFCFLMDMCMVGSGVGGDTKGAGKVRIQEPRYSDKPYVIEDTREAWVELIRIILNSFVGKGFYPNQIDYSKVRLRGELIKGFGGISSGPEPLMSLVESISNLLKPTDEQPYRITSGQIVDVFNFIGKCLPEDTWVSTKRGPKKIRDLIGESFEVLVNGISYPLLSKGFFHTGKKQIFKVRTKQGWELRATEDHLVMSSEGWVPVKNLKEGDSLFLHEHTNISWGGSGTEDEGYLLGFLVGDGSICQTQWGELAQLFSWDQDIGSCEVREYTENIVKDFPHRSDWGGWGYNGGKGRQRLACKSLTQLAASYGIVKGNKTITVQVEETSSAFYAGFLRGLFDADGSVNPDSHCIFLSQSNERMLKSVQRMLSRLGILSSVYYGGREEEWVLYIGGVDAQEYMKRVGFRNTRKRDSFLENKWLRGPYKRKPLAVVTEIVPEGVEDVYDVSVEDVHAFDANGFYVHNCIVAGNVRRSSEIMLGDIDDDAFLALKQDPVALADRRWASNNSIFAKVGMDYSKVIGPIAENGEPGIFWLENAQKYSRMVGWADNKDFRVSGVNPCFVGYTLIAVADGRGAVPIRQLAEDGVDVPVYSVDPDGKVGIKWGRNPRKTGVSAKLVEILLEDGTSLRVTPNHKMLLLDGVGCEAQDLQPGDSLPRFTKRQETVSATSNKKYLRVYGNTLDARKDKVFEHRLIADFYFPEKMESLRREGVTNGWMRGGVVVHHKNFDPLDNRPENLEVMSFRDHNSYHAKLSYAGADNPMWGREHTAETKKRIGEKTKERCADPEYLQRLSESHTQEERQASSQRMSERRREEWRVYYEQEAARTHLEVEWVGGRLFAKKKCETCEESFLVSWRCREQAHCSRKCVNQSQSHTEKRVRGQRSFFKDKQRQTLHDQIMVFKDLQQMFTRDPLRKEWEQACREKGVAFRIRGGKKYQPKNEFVLTSYGQLKERVVDYNHRVREVRILEEVGDVYNITVDENHTVGIVTEFDLEKKTCKGLFSLNCGEQSLESGEMCNLVETFPANHETFDDYRRTLKYAYLYAKSVTLIPTHNDRTNAVMGRNRRIGCSMTGIIQAIQKFGRRTFLKGCNKGYEYINELDKKYSDWLCIPRSIKMTTVKPSGTVSLLSGATPGIHYPQSEYYIRNIRVMDTSPLVEMCRRAGYFVEPDKMSPNTQVVSFPVKERGFVKAKKDVTIWEQFANAADLQQYWTDNQVSITITFKPEEKGDIQACLGHFETKLKAVALLPLSDHGYVQAPYITITKEEYEEAMRGIDELDLSGAEHDITAEDKFCDGDSCAVTLEPFKG